MPESSNSELDDSDVITRQPEAKVPDLNKNGIESPSGMPADNPALEDLKMVDQLIVSQKREWLKRYCLCCELKVTYTISNNARQPLYSIVKELQCCPLFGQMRELNIMDNKEREVIHLSSSFRSECCLCCFQRTEIRSPPGHLLGVAQQECRGLLSSPHLNVNTAEGETLFKIYLPLCQAFSSTEFPVYDVRKKENIGTITLLWSGRVYITYADRFEITFPMELDVNEKAMLLGALFLTDLTFVNPQRMYYYPNTNVSSPLSAF